MKTANWSVRQRTNAIYLSILVCLSISGSVTADLFGTGANQFAIDFVTISGNTNPTGTYGMGVVRNDYRMGTFEITNEQWTKFQAVYGPVTGSPAGAYDANPAWTGTHVPVNSVSWYEAAQFVNWLNTSTGHAAAYKFTGTQGASGYSFGIWQAGDSGYDAQNPFRNSNAFYFLPSENEWVKAAYWNGTLVQTWATAGDTTPAQDGWNFYGNGYYAADPYGPWDVGSGSVELNGTYDMMGNVFEWTESPWESWRTMELMHYTPAQIASCDRIMRGGSWAAGDENSLDSSERYAGDPAAEYYYFSNRGIGFRAAAAIPEPAAAVLMTVGLLLSRQRKALSKRT